MLSCYVTSLWFPKSGLEAHFGDRKALTGVQVLGAVGEGLLA